jgi:hypothetical protein
MPEELLFRRESLTTLGAASPLSVSERTPLRSEATASRQGCAVCEAVLRITVRKTERQRSTEEPGRRSRRRPVSLSRTVDALQDRRLGHPARIFSS